MDLTRAPTALSATSGRWEVQRRKVSRPSPRVKIEQVLFKPQPRTLREGLLRDIAGFRAEKDSYFRSDPNSPVPREERFMFKGLEYFPPSSAYRVKARQGRLEKPATVTMTTSKGTTPPYLNYGTFEFELEGNKQRRYCYKAADNPLDTSLFVPFTDETSRKETYGAGRYVDIEETRGHDNSLDFNLAYNPYCAYNENYACPMPLRENRLPVRIPAGEKTTK